MSLQDDGIRSLFSLISDQISEGKEYGTNTKLLLQMYRIQSITCIGQKNPSANQALVITSKLQRFSRAQDVVPFLKSLVRCIYRYQINDINTTDAANLNGSYFKGQQTKLFYTLYMITTVARLLITFFALGKLGNIVAESCFLSMFPCFPIAALYNAGERFQVCSVFFIHPV